MKVLCGMVATMVKRAVTGRWSLKDTATATVFAAFAVIAFALAAIPVAALAPLLVTL